MREYNTHVMDVLPESAADTVVPVAVEDGRVYIDLLNLARLVAMEANDIDATDEPNDADAVVILQRVAFLAALPADDGWVALGGIEDNPLGDKWLTTDKVVRIDRLPLSRASAAGFRYRRFNIWTLRDPLPFGSWASGPVEEVED